tara:strand:- start:287 stop:1069 length:783 start_codon:yes stop_codon:yes gene_type:complete
MKKNRALDGFRNEEEFVQKLNLNKKHPFWKTINLIDNKNLYFVRVAGNKNSKLTNKKIPCKADVFVSEIDLDENQLKSNDYLINENQKLKFIKKLPFSGISIKMSKTNYQIDKCSLEKFVKRFGDKFLFIGATIYSRDLKDFEKNHNVLEATKTSWREFGEYFESKTLETINKHTKFNKEHKNIFEKIQKNSNEQIKFMAINNPKILDSLYKGTDEFDDPYCATWLLINNELTKKIPKDLIVTKGSSKGGTRPQVEFKPN